MAISACRFSVIAPKGETDRSAAELIEASQAERRRSLFEPGPLGEVVRGIVAWIGR
jgi:alkyl sulfatase BDS1-like metallo-beta-lactamase superfamily hydrolase